MKKYRHGDVILIQCENIKGKKLKYLTLAEGEVTGHSHQITQGEAELYESGGTLYLSIRSDEASLTHEEHKEIKLPKGNYEIQIQREYSPDAWENGFRKVKD
jgi:hypothetical protein